jgi:hypothetical protein
MGGKSFILAVRAPFFAHISLVISVAYLTVAVWPVGANTPPKCEKSGPPETAPEVSISPENRVLSALVEVLWRAERAARPGPQLVE